MLDQVRVLSFYGSRAILSGPAGGVVGVALTAYNTDTRQPVIGFDMGGTSTDVRVDLGSRNHLYLIRSGLPICGRF